jgi:hypothetical protein
MLHLWQTERRVGWKDYIRRMTGWERNYTP